MSDILHSLNEYQKEAVTTTEGPLLVLAGAGSGKTKVITHRIAYILSLGIPEDAILALTFTNKAAGEMKSRIESQLGFSCNHLWISTFHSFGSRILRTEYQFTNRDRYFTIFDTTDVKRAIKIILEKMQLSKVLDVKNVIYSISLIKNKFLDQDQIRQEFYHTRIGEYIVRIFVEYEKYLEHNNAYDFDDLLYKTVLLFKNNINLQDKYKEKFQYIMIDEFQDTNSIQLSLIKLITQQRNNLCIVGDEDQSIYKWRGADIQNILNFPKMYDNAKTIDLKYNYRCDDNILKCALSLIENNKGRFNKSIEAKNSGGEKVKYFQCLNDDDGITYIIDTIIANKQSGIELDTIAIIYRTNAQSRALEKRLKGVIPYKIIGSMYFYERKEIKDIMCLLQVIENRSNNIALLRVLDNVYKGIGKTTIQKLIDYSFEKNITIFESLSQVKSIDSLNKGTMSKLSKVYDDITKYIDLNREDDFSFEEITKLMFSELEYYTDIYRKAKETNDEEIIGRVENLNEFKNEILEYITKTDIPTLTGFLEAITLQMQAKNSGERCVNLLTLHSSKGLEFESVFIYGLEDGMIPLIREFDDDVDIEEERRLLYVGITRAKNHLSLIKRLEYPFPGKRTVESRFINEIDDKHYENLFSKEMDRKSSYTYDDGYDNYYSRSSKRVPENSFGNMNYPLKRKEKPVEEEIKGVTEIGEKVIHRIFGMGRVISINGDITDPTVIIDFINVGKKKIKYNAAGLKKV